MANINMSCYFRRRKCAVEQAHAQAGLVMLVALLHGGLAWAQPAAFEGTNLPVGRNVEGIADNSFLVEEAYNQEPGVVQHILTALFTSNSEGDDTRNWNLAFTQEWPLFSQQHQLSYTLPYNFTKAGGVSADGIGDVLLNYRYQLCYDDRTLTAFAPRFSLILPTGDDLRGGGEETLGYQINLPFSTTFDDDWFVHLNAGSTFLPEAASGDGRDLWHYNLGASAIYAPTPHLHVLLEWVGGWFESWRSSSGSAYEFISVISPGVRQAVNFSNGAQLVLGAAVPIGLNPAAPDYGVFLYVSFEHFFGAKL